MPKTIKLHGAPFKGGVEIDPAYPGPREFFDPVNEREAEALVEAFPFIHGFVYGEKPRMCTPNDHACLYSGISENKRWGIGIYCRASDGDILSEFVEFDEMTIRNFGLGDVSYFFKDGKIHFTGDGLRHFTEEERNQLAELHEQHAKKFDEICDHVATALGYDPKEVSDEQRAQIIEEAEELTEQWDEDVEMSDDPEQAKKAVTPEPGIQTLLAAYHELGERIMDIRDTAVDRDLEEDDEAA